jgi:DNA-binding NarL/FixJ family response regulator
MRAKLTIRQEQLLHLLTQGKTNVQCAFAMGTTESSVEQLRKKVMTNTGCLTAVELGVWACQRSYHIANKRLAAPVASLERRAYI